MATFAYIVCMLQTVLGKSDIELVCAVEKEVGVAAGKPIKLVAGLLDALELRVKLRRLVGPH